MIESEPDLPQRGPTPLKDLLTDLFATRGLARMQAAVDLEQAWGAAIGEPNRARTRVEGLRRGVLNVNVAHPILLEELAAFRKPDLLRVLRQRLPGVRIQDIRFRVGPVGD